MKKPAITHKSAPNFLATTSLAEFWPEDTNSFILFLGPWCRRKDKESEWVGRNYRQLKNPWSDRGKFNQTAVQLNEIYENVLADLHSLLNEIHQTRFSLRYWRIFIGPWLINFLHAVYDRYIHLIKAMSDFGQLETIILDESCHRIPRDTHEQVRWIANDPYNLQLISQLLVAMGRTCERRMYSGYWASDFECDTRDRKLKDVLSGQKTALLGLFHKVRRKFDREVDYCLFYDAYISSAAMVQLEAACDFKIFFETGYSISSQQNRTNNSIREKIKNVTVGRGEFVKLFGQLLSLNLPKVFLENYRSERDRLFRSCRTLPTVVVSSIGWYSSDIFTLLAAESAEAKSKVVAVQHGGGYGVHRQHPFEMHERKIADEFFVWGWADVSLPNTTNVPSPNFSRISNREKSKEKVFYVMTGFPAYLYRFHSAPVGDQLEHYHEWQCSFFGALPKSIRSGITVKPYFLDFGRKQRVILSERFPELIWDDGGVVREKLATARLMVVDHLGTSILESLAADVPTIAFWDPAYWEIRTGAQKYFNHLNEAGILCVTPESAARKVEEVWDEPDLWWEQDPVIKAKESFVERFAMNRANWVESWNEQLQRLFKDGNSNRDPTGAVS